MEKINNTQYTTFEDIWNDPNLLSEEEKERIDFEVSIIGKIIEMREEKGFTQKELAKRAGLNQSAIGRLEGMKVSPQINTLYKILKPLDCTLAIVPNKKMKK